MTLDDLNAATPADFVAAMGEVFEHAPWIAAQATAARPFATVIALHAAMMAVLQAAVPETQMAFLRGHPDLGGSVARRRAMAAFSVNEQASAGLDQLDEARFAAFERLNAAYTAKFAMPFLICVRRHTRDSILEQFAARLERTPEAEQETALGEIFRITRLRVAGLVNGPGMPATTGWLSTHVLDTAGGRPVAGAAVELFEQNGSAWRQLCATITNHDGRTDAPLISGGPLPIGRYELRFHVGPHFAASNPAPAPDGPAFIDMVPVRFGIADAEAHYHVPLLVSPWSYSVYRGS